MRRHHRGLGDLHGPDPPVTADRLGVSAATLVGRGMRPVAAFKESAALLQGRKLILFWQIVVWLVFRILLACAIAALFDAMIGWVPSLLGDSLS